MPPHLVGAREIVSTSSSARAPCYAFVNDVLKQHLPHVLEERDALYEEVIRECPPSHRYKERIPYHYFLIARMLYQGARSRFWKARSATEEVCPGDIFISIHPEYNPDPQARSPDEPETTHVGFVDEIIKDGGTFKIRLIDYSMVRRRGRTKNLEEQGDSSAEGIAYSFLVISLHAAADLPEKAIWNCKFLNQRNVFKHLAFLAVSYPD